jgi:hypothetical protein
MCTPAGHRFVKDIAIVETLQNAILALISPSMWEAGMDTIYRMQSGDHHHKHQIHPSARSWPSAFTALQVIVNRKTPLHRDRGGAPPIYDLLTSAGTHTYAEFCLQDLKATLSYAPGTVIVIAGKVLLHRVEEWRGGERICIAHYMPDAVINRVGVVRPDWVVRGDLYDHLMGTGFKMRRGI